MFSFFIFEIEPSLLYSVALESTAKYSVRHTGDMNFPITNRLILESHICTRECFALLRVGNGKTDIRAEAYLC